MEEAIKGDVAFVRAWRVDEAGNAVFRYTANNFSAAMAKSARVTVVEVSLSSTGRARSETLGRGDCANRLD